MNCAIVAGIFKFLLLIPPPSSVFSEYFVAHEIGPLACKMQVLQSFGLKSLSTKFTWGGLPAGVMKIKSNF